MGSSETTPLALATSLSVAMAAGTPAWEGAPGASPKPSPSPGLSPAVVPDAATSQARVPERLDSFGSPDSAGLAQHGGVSPTFNANKFGSPGSVVHSPHHTQGTHGHVAKMVDWVQGAATEELVPLSAEKTNSSDGKHNSAKRASRSSLSSSVAGGFALATSGALQRLRASRDAPETPVLVPKIRRSLRSASMNEIEEEIALARRMSPLAMDTRLDTHNVYASPGNTVQRSVANHDLLTQVTVDPYDFDLFAEQFPDEPGSPVSVAPQTPRSPQPNRDGSSSKKHVSNLFSPVHDVNTQTPTHVAFQPAVGSSPELAKSSESDAGDDVSERETKPACFDEAFAAKEASPIAAAIAAMSPVPESPYADETKVHHNTSPAVLVLAKENVDKENATSAIGAGPAAAAQTEPEKEKEKEKVAPLRPSAFINAVHKLDPNSARAVSVVLCKPLPVSVARDVLVTIPKSTAPVPAPSAAKKRAGGDAGPYLGHAMTPLPISKSVLDRIDALGPEMQPAQKYILLLGIALDFYAKTQLIRELNRFALMGDTGGWAWFTFVFLFFLLSGSMTAAYWLLHYPMPTETDQRELKDSKKKMDFKKMVRTAGAVCCLLQLGTAFAAWRALRVKDIRQRKAEMDLRGMQLVDTVFLLLPVATLQAYVGMKCSSPDLTCPGRSGFDALLFCAVLGAITSASLCFVSLDLHEKPPSLTWPSYWKAHKPHLSETAAKTIFKFFELSARISLIALFGAVHGGYVFFVFAVHSVFVLVGLKNFDKLIGGGVPDKNVWQKFVRCDLVITVSEKHKWWPESLFKGRTIALPTLDDTKLLVAAMLWPPSMFVANATDSKGRFWWRSKTCPRRSFLSVDRNDAIFPLPAFVALQVAEACLMFLVIGTSITNSPHYHAYFAASAIVNMAWLMAVVGWISGVTLWNPFLSDGPPLAGFARLGNGTDGTADAPSANAYGQRGGWSGWHGTDAMEDEDDAHEMFSPKNNAGVNVAASMATTGVFSPSGRTPGGGGGGRSRGSRGSNGLQSVAASYAHTAPMEREVAEKPAARALLFPDEESSDKKVSVSKTTSVPEVPKWDPVAAEARAVEAEKKRVLALEIEKTRKKEAARREIARLDALRREEARAAMRREADVLEAKRLEAFSKKRKEHKSAGTAKPPAVPKPPQPLVQPPPTDDQTVTKENTSRRQSGGLFGRPGIVVSKSQER